MEGGMPMARPRSLRGRQLYALLRELADTSATQTELAERYGITQGRVSQLKKEFAAEIAEMAADVEDEYAGLWIAKKSERIKSYLRLAEALEADMEENGLDPAYMRQYQNCLKNVAEELGQLPAKVIVKHEGPKADYTVGGVDPRDLR